MPTAFEFEGTRYKVIDLVAEAGDRLYRMPYIHRILLENVLRTAEDAQMAIQAFLEWVETGGSDVEIPFLPNRVLMHDTTCGPALVDIAGMRSALAEAGGDPVLLNPVVPVDVSTDHSVAVDVFGTASARERNVRREYERNAERYSFMKWATNTLANFRVHPPGTGIMHTLNLERLATVATALERDGVLWAVPDTLIGTDSHTPMINGIGVLGWGVGGLEAESVFFGMPVALRVPDVVGVRMTGSLREGVLATDLALVVTHLLRQSDLQDKFVEFYGPGVSNLTAGDRAVVANMTPEFGANSGYFPIDHQSIGYLARTGRSREHCAFVEAYAKRVGIWFDPNATPRYSSTVELDLATVEASLAGPRRPQDRIAIGDTRAAIAGMKRKAIAPLVEGEPNDGAVAIAAITSCTNTSDPRLLIAAGLVARKARAFGLRPPRWVKTSTAPGSPTAERYLRRAGLLDDLEAIGFGIVGYGCTTCIGNSGPLTEPVVSAIAERDILPVAVLSGNRNFPGRVHPQLEAGFLASPPMVVAFALAGSVELDIIQDPIGISADGRPVTLKMLWPQASEIDEAMTLASSTSDFAPSYDAAEASEAWKDLPAPTSTLFPWDETSTYIRRPPFANIGSGTRLGVYEAHPILVVGDDITTDHISPAGAIPPTGDAGRHLIERGENPIDLNVFSSRRGNWEVMIRGLFTNKTVRNLIGEDIPPGSTIHAGTGEVLSLWEAAQRYKAEGRATVIVAGERYGMGSSRDWAAKGVALLGVRAVLTSSFERIHRWNLIGMGVLPLRLPTGTTPETLGLSADATIIIEADPSSISPRAAIAVGIRHADGSLVSLDATAAIETHAEVEILRAGGVLPLILERLTKRRLST
ncbi:aconitate hydratase AcnA (plasmid) [Sinorhizobium meliloti WSM1022]|uniref:aconitate hydratase AcnA n=1 Tax=Rhizobium meliloti TaxID=382 RepID=UPI0002D82B81|nr:aconitate hydratase AcnA [Sinorhizobium meliloti]MDE3761946.1 aconitate hydratase AcnA [Sinorhizobium meliloti]MDE3820828.1 aconitate hydratase AcnA [Sinorhizobium meliloti]MDE3831502.1 aconitate hydratase AcnA [Sinorhizobium meliloti]MDE4579189.1 aconitate hydratase AcnA [Sinorhizobium meliloti]MDW9552008.1 aconitate hydratase AcnA [Sinorhizobium meliloti]